jgi:hypothetical protein
MITGRESEQKSWNRSNFLPVLLLAKLDIKVFSQYLFATIIIELKCAKIRILP